MKYTCTLACEKLGICNIFGCKHSSLRFYSMLNFTNVHENCLFYLQPEFLQKKLFWKHSQTRSRRRMLVRISVIHQRMMMMMMIWRHDCLFVFSCIDIEKCSLSDDDPQHLSYLTIHTNIFYNRKSSKNILDVLFIRMYLRKFQTITIYLCDSHFNM